MTVILIVKFGFPRSSRRTAEVELVTPQAKIDASHLAFRQFAVLQLIPAFVLRWSAVREDTPRWSPFVKLLLIAADLCTSELNNSTSLQTVQILEYTYTHSHAML